MECKCKDSFLETIVLGVNVTNILRPSLSCKIRMPSADMIALKV